MSVLFILLFLFCFIALIVGLVKPSWTVKWGKHRTRGMVFLYYGVGAFLFFILFGVTVPSDSTTSPPSVATSSTPSTNSTTSTPSTPTSTPSKPAVPAPPPQPTPPPAPQPNAENQLSFLNAFTAIDQSIQIDQQSKDFVQKHPKWFPAASSDTSYDGSVDHSLTIPMILKDPSSYYSSLYQNNGIVIDIKQFHNPEYAVVQVSIVSGDETGDQAVVMYEGKTGSIVQGSTVSFVGLPVSEWDFDNVSGGTTKSILFDGVSLKQIQ